MYVGLARGPIPSCAADVVTVKHMRPRRVARLLASIAQGNQQIHPHTGRRIGAGEQRQ